MWNTTSKDYYHRLEKIVKIEQQHAQGKQLDDDQLELLNSKKSVEKLVLDLATLKKQVEEIAAQVTAEAAEAEAAAKAAQEKQDAEKPVEVAVEEVPSETKEEGVNTAVESTHEEKSFSMDVETNTEELETSPKFTMTEPVAEVPPPAPVTVYLPDPAAIELALRKILKVLHVYQRYQSVTTNSLPESVDFFGKTLLGLTSITPFYETLNSSLKSSAKYLDVSQHRFFTTLFI